jgi:hypothetical protein
MYKYNVWLRCSLRACEGKTEWRAAKTSSYIALVCSPSLRFARRRLINCTNDRKSQGVRTSTLYNTLRTRQFPHMHNSVSSLIACEDTIMCKGGNGLVRSVLHVSHYEGGIGLWGRVFQKNLRCLVRMLWTSTCSKKTFGVCRRMR